MIIQLFDQLDITPKLTTHQHSIYLNQTQNSLRNLFEHFNFIRKIKFWKKSWVTTIFTFKTRLLCRAQIFSPFTMKASCSLESFRSTTNCMWMWAWLQSNELLNTPNSSLENDKFQSLYMQKVLELPLVDFYYIH
jgi:hypothetical protein